MLRRVKTYVNVNNFVQLWIHQSYPLMWSTDGVTCAYTVCSLKIFVAEWWLHGFDKEMLPTSLLTYANAALSPSRCAWVFYWRFNLGMELEIELEGMLCHFRVIVLNCILASQSGECGNCCLRLCCVIIISLVMSFEIFTIFESGCDHIK